MLNITFGDKKSYDDWRLKLVSISIGFPEVKKSSVDVPAADGVMDFAETFGDLKYGNRTFEAVFEQDGRYEEWSDQSSEIARYLHGQFMRVILDTDPDYYYEGRLSVRTAKDNDVYHELVISGDMQPYKMRLQETVVKCEPGTDKTVVLHNGRKRLFPQITTTAEARIVFGNASFSLDTGTHRILGIKLYPGENTLTVTSEGSVEFRYREGEL